MYSKGSVFCYKERLFTNSLATGCIVPVLIEKENSEEWTFVIGVNVDVLAECYFSFYGILFWDLCGVII